MSEHISINGEFPLHPPTPSPLQNTHTHTHTHTDKAIVCDVRQILVVYHVYLKDSTKPRK